MSALDNFGSVLIKLRAVDVSVRVDEHGTARRLLFKSSSVGHVFGEGREHRSTFLTERGGDYHTLRFEPAQFSRFKVRHHNHLPTKHLFRLIVLGDTGE